MVGPPVSAGGGVMVGPPVSAGRGMMVGLSITVSGGVAARGRVMDVIHMNGTGSMYIHSIHACM